MIIPQGGPSSVAWPLDDPSGGMVGTGGGFNLPPQFLGPPITGGNPPQRPFPGGRPPGGPNVLFPPRPGMTPPGGPVPGGGGGGGWGLGAPPGSGQGMMQRPRPQWWPSSLPWPIPRPADRGGFANFRAYALSLYPQLAQLRPGRFPQYTPPPPTIGGPPIIQPPIGQDQQPFGLGPSGPPVYQPPPIG